MTIEGAIAQLQELIDNDGIPFWAKPSLQKVMETVEMEREQHIEALQERKTGKWIDHIEDGYVECPVCGHLTTCWNEDCIEELHYCFWCGARLTIPIAAATAPAMERQHKNGSAMLAGVTAADGTHSANGRRTKKITTTGNKTNNRLRRPDQGQPVERDTDQRTGGGGRR